MNTKRPAKPVEHWFLERDQQPLIEVLEPDDLIEPTETLRQSAEQFEVLRREREAQGGTSLPALSQVQMEIGDLTEERR